MDSNSCQNSEIFPFKSIEAAPPIISYHSITEEKSSIKPGLLRRPYSSNDATLISDLLRIESKPLLDYREDEKDLEILEAFRKINETTLDTDCKHFINEPIIVQCPSPVLEGLETNQKEEKLLLADEFSPEDQEKFKVKFNKGFLESELHKEDEDDDNIVPFSVKISTTPTKQESNGDERYTPCSCNSRLDPNKHKHTSSSPLKLKLFNIPLGSRSNNSQSSSSDKFQNSYMPKSRIRRSKSAQSVHMRQPPVERNRPVSAQPNVLNLFAATSFKEHSFHLGKQTLQTLSYMDFLERKQKNVPIENKPPQKIQSEILKTENKITLKSSKKDDNLTPVVQSRSEHDASHLFTEKDREGNRKSTKDVQTDRCVNPNYRLSFRNSNKGSTLSNCYYIDCGKNHERFSAKESDKKVFTEDKIMEKNALKTDKQRQVNGKDLIFINNNESTIKEIVRPTSKVIKQTHDIKEKKYSQLMTSDLKSKRTKRVKSAPSKRVTVPGMTDRAGVQPKQILRKSSVPNLKEKSTVTMISLLNSGKRSGGIQKQQRANNKMEKYCNIEKTDASQQIRQQFKVSFRSFSDSKSLRTEEESSPKFDQKELDEYLKQRKKSRNCVVSQECIDLYSKLKDKNVQVSLDTLQRALMKPSEMN